LDIFYSILLLRRMKFYGVLSYVWLNPKNIILGNLKEGLVDGILISSVGYQENRTYRKWIRRNQKHIPSIMVDHEAWTRFKRGVVWSYTSIKQIQEWACHNLKLLGFDDVVTIAPDIISNAELTKEYQERFYKEFTGETVYPYQGLLIDGPDYLAIPKINLNQEYIDQIPKDKYKLHALGVTPKEMPLIVENDFFSCDATIDSGGWSKNRIEDFRTSVNTKQYRCNQE